MKANKIATWIDLLTRRIAYEFRTGKRASGLRRKEKLARKAVGLGR